MQQVARDPLVLDDRERCRQFRDCKNIGSRRAGIGRFHDPNLQIGAGSGIVDIALANPVISAGPALNEDLLRAVCGRRRDRGSTSKNLFAKRQR
jgi:hypothetical protein